MRILSLIAVAALGAGIGLGPRPSAAAEVYYTTGNFGAEIFAITVNGTQITSKEVGPIGVPGCASLALSKWGTLYSVCGDLFGTQQLTAIDLKTGHGTVFGVPTPGLAVMAMAFGPDGTLYAVGDCNFQPATIECARGNDPNYNSLYSVDTATGAFKRIGSTGAPEYFMDLAFDREGRLFGVTTTLSPTYVPARLYEIDPATGAATKLVDLIGSSQIMGLAFGPDGRLYGTDFVNSPGVYLIDPKTGLEAALAALPFSLSSGLELVSARED